MSNRIDSAETAVGTVCAGAAPAGVASASIPDSDRLQAFIERYGADQAATMHAATVLPGDRLGLYAALAAHGPCPPEDRGDVTGCHPRLLREWLNAQVASGYTEHDPAGGTYWLTPEQAACLADPASPTYLIGGMLAASSNHKDVDALARAFTSGGGLGWGGHHPDLYVGTQRLFGPVYRANLVPHWIPSLEGMQARLESGARVVDVGCSHSEALIRLAEAYPASRFAGFDNHAPRLRLGLRLQCPARVGRGRRNLSRSPVKPGSPGAGVRPRLRCSWSWKPDPEVMAVTRDVDTASAADEAHGSAWRDRVACRAAPGRISIASFCYHR